MVRHSKHPTEHPPGKWASELLLREARARMRSLVNDNNARIQTMLRDLITEAGWSQDEFLDALVKDVAAHGEDKWAIPAPNPLAAVASHSRTSHRPGPRKSSPPPPRTKSGVMAKVQVPHTKKAAG